MSGRLWCLRASTPSSRRPWRSYLPLGAAGGVPRALLVVPIQDCGGAGGHCRRPMGDEWRQSCRRGGSGPLGLPGAAPVAAPSSAAAAPQRRWRRWQVPWRWPSQPQQQQLPRGLRRERSPTPGGALRNDDGSGSNDGGSGSLHDGAHVGTGICFHHYTYGRSTTRCKPPCLFA
jgi:hypothetical protein